MSGRYWSMLLVFLGISGIMDSANAAATPEVEKALQGKWQSTDDKLSRIEFSKGLMKSVYAGKAETPEKYALGERCGSESAKESPASLQCKNGYLWVTESDLCWCIIEVTKKSLVLSYVDRGNTLTYYRIGRVGRLN